MSCCLLQANVLVHGHAGEGWCGLTFQSRLIEGHLLLEMTCCYTKGSNRAPQVRISLIIRTLTTGELRDNGATERNPRQEKLLPGEGQSEAKTVCYSIESVYNRTYRIERDTAMHCILFLNLQQVSSGFGTLSLLLFIEICLITCRPSF